MMMAGITDWFNYNETYK